MATTKSGGARKLVGDWFDSWWEQVVDSILARHERRIRALEIRMSELTDKLDAIDAASTQEAEALQTLADQVAALRDQINNGTLPDDAATRLDSIASALTDRATFMTNLASDPNNPVPPAPEPVPPAPDSGA